MNPLSFVSEENTESENIIDDGPFVHESTKHVEGCSSISGLFVFTFKSIVLR